MYGKAAAFIWYDRGACHPRAVVAPSAAAFVQTAVRWIARKAGLLSVRKQQPRVGLAKLYTQADRALSAIIIHLQQTMRPCNLRDCRVRAFWWGAY